MNLWCDNDASIYIAKNQVFHDRAKHIEVDHRFSQNLDWKDYNFPCSQKSYLGVELFTCILSWHDQYLCFILMGNVEVYIVVSAIRLGSLYGLVVVVFSCL